MMIEHFNFRNIEPATFLQQGAIPNHSVNSIIELTLNLREVGSAYREDYHVKQSSC